MKNVVESNLNKVFDDYSEVKECTECESWWTNQCDGASEGLNRPCTAFKAVRRVSIPEDIRQLKQAIKTLRTWLIIFAIWGISAIIIITAYLEKLT